MNKQLSFLLLFLLSLTTTFAQVNPQRGYVITNQNDTISGTIDYLSDAKNAYECHFKADGENQYKTYQPGDVRAYRFTDNGIFYITKTLTVDGEQKTFFAEYLLQGGVSLFHHKEKGNDYYYLIDEDGKTGIVKNDGVISGTPQEVDRKKRAALREASQLLVKSSKAQSDLWKKDITSENLTTIVRDYDMEYCTAAGDCVLFRYNSKKSRSIGTKIRLQVAAGLGTVKLSPTANAYDTEDVAMKTFTPQIGAGIDFFFPRASKHWSLQLLGVVSKWSMSKDILEFFNDKKMSTAELKFIDLELQVGAAYSFMPESNISPVLRGGLVVDQPVAISMKHLNSFHVGKGENSITAAVGFYIGAGADIPFLRHKLRLTAEYKRTHSNFSGLTINNLAVSAGIRL